MNSITDIYRKSQLPPEAVPDGWYTTNAWADKEGMSRSTIQRMLTRLCETGDMQMKKFRIEAGQIIRHVPHYRLNERGEKK